MEFQQQDEEMINNHVGKMSNNTNNNNSNNNNNNYYLCRQSSTRWTPTTEQIKLLKDLYYLQGIRSPTADQIQSICARLRRYGKIEGKNVFYWFQNHKARERQKKKLTPTSPNNNNNNNNFIRNNNNNTGNINTFHAKYPCSFNNNPGISCSSSTAGVISGSGQLMGSFGYGAVTMENKFRDCSISGGGIPIPNGGNQWSNYFNPNNPTSYSNFFIDKVSSNVDHHHHHPYINHHDHHHHHHHDHDHYGPQSPHEIQTLPLFPMHNDHHDRDHDHDLDLDLDHDQGFYTYKPQSDGCNYTGGYRWSSNVNGGHTSLELSLNSYGFGCYSPN